MDAVADGSRLKFEIQASRSCIFTNSKFNILLSLYGAANTASIDAVFEHVEIEETFRCPVILKADFILIAYFYLLAFPHLQVPGYL